MNFHVLMWVMFSLTTAYSNSISETHTLIESSNITKPGCQSQCGDLIVPYPFGIGINSGCSIGRGFDITCDTSTNPPMASIPNPKGYTSIKNISDSKIRASSMAFFSHCYSHDLALKNIGTNKSNSTDSLYNKSNWIDSFYSPPDLRNLPYTFSQENMLTAVGCNGVANLSISGNVNTACAVFCSGNNVSECSGDGCCQTSIPHDISKGYNVHINRSLDPDDPLWNVPGDKECAYAFLAEPGAFKFNSSTDLRNISFTDKIETDVTVVLDWAIGNLSCEEANGTKHFACQSNTTCVNSTRVTGGYLCMCKKGYEGNPYLSPGCQDINECKHPETIPCYGSCINTPGSYNCTCPPGSSGNATIVNGCQSKSSSTALIIATVVGLLAVFCGASGLFFGLRRRKLMKLREKFFEQNGGVLLKQKINSQGSHNAMTLFSTAQLRKATKNYAEENIIGRGAYGVVYKGVLFDKRVVAIKKAKLVDVSQAHQFINELLILTQVIHRNVVKILGCCLEEEVPILVYEYISNNTLWYHIHSRFGGMSWLSWDNRLRVAVEASSALAYLHSETTMPIVHRDVKSTNILLDDNYTAKISDFGASRLIPLDHEQVTTLIQGTLGYLDPEYFNTSLLTDKSDVYSFGVVLAELITGKKPIGVDRFNEDKNLASYFVNALKENRFYEIVEPRILREGTLEQIQLVGVLVKRCLSLEGRDRPTMKEVATELDKLRKFKTRPWIQQETNEIVEQSDLYDVPLMSYNPSEQNSSLDSKSYYSGTNMGFEESKPR